MFNNEQSGKVLYSPQANRIFILNGATFFEVPSLEREDGKKLILMDFKHAKELIKSETNDRYHLELIGEL